MVCVWLLATEARAQTMFAPEPCVDLPAAKIEALESFLADTKWRAHGGGPSAIGSMIGQIEITLNAAPSAIPKIQDCPGEILIQVSDLTESRAWMSWVTSKDVQEHFHKNGSIWLNPFAGLAFYAGSYYIENKDYLAAERVLRRGLALAPLDPLISSELAFALSLQGRHAESLATADAALDRVIPIDSDSRGLLKRQRGSALGELGRFDEAIAAYREAIKLRPEYEGPLTGEIRYLEGQKAHQPPAPVRVTVGPPKS